MPWVKIKPGRTHGASRQYRAGDVFEATADELRDFGDKFEVVAPSAPVGIKAAPADMVEATAVEVPELPARRPTAKRKPR